MILRKENESEKWIYENVKKEEERRGIKEKKMKLMGRGVMIMGR